jgi:hypothetical protein
VAKFRQMILDNNRNLTETHAWYKTLQSNLTRRLQCIITDSNKATQQTDYNKPWNHSNFQPGSWKRKRSIVRVHAWIEPDCYCFARWGSDTEAYQQRLDVGSHYPSLTRNNVSLAIVEYLPYFLTKLIYITCTDPVGPLDRRSSFFKDVLKSSLNTL